MYECHNGKLTAAIWCSEKTACEHRSSTDFHSTHIADIMQIAQIAMKVAYINNFESLSGNYAKDLGRAAENRCSVVLGGARTQVSTSTDFRAVFFDFSAIGKIKSCIFTGFLASVFTLIRYHVIIIENRCSECSVEVRKDLHREKWLVLSSINDFGHAFTLQQSCFKKTSTEHRNRPFFP